MGGTAELESLSEEFYEHTVRSCRDEAESFTVPIFGLQEGQARLDRSGVLLQIAEDCFLITAAHDLGAIAKIEVPMCISTAAPDSELLPLDDMWAYALNENLEDVAVLKLSSDSADQLRGTKQFLRLRDLDLQAEASFGLYLIVGYPREWSMSDGGRRQVSCRPLHYGSMLYSGETQDGLPCDGEKHLLLGYEQMPVKLPNGGELTPPPVGGMSGCGIWRLAKSRPGLFDTWAPDERRLVAIQHRWSRPHGYIRGTWIKEAARIIVQQYPELRRPILLEYPTFEK